MEKYGNATGELRIKVLSSREIPDVVSYWMNASDEHLIGMGVDLSKVPPAETMTAFLQSQVNLPNNEKDSLAVIAFLDGKPCGHCNVNQIKLGEEAYMHLHLWPANIRKKGLGTTMVMHALPLFFETLQLKRIWCEPYAKNPAPNAALRKMGFEFVKTYTTIPGSINFEQEVNQYVMTKVRFDEICSDN